MTIANTNIADLLAAELAMADALRTDLDADLIRRVATGNTDAFRVLVERHSDALSAYVCARVGPGPSEDVVAEIWVTAWKSASRYQSAYPSAKPWLFGIATRILHKHWEAESRWQRAIMAAGAIDSDVYAPEAEDLTDPELLAALAQLRQSEREVLVLVSLGEMSVREASEALGISQVAARVRLHRARINVMKLLSNGGAAK